MLGCHCAHHFSSSQSTIALSSGEAELNAAVKTGSELIGLRNLMNGFAVDLYLELSLDSSAAKGICQRRGSGKVKHLEVKQLWLQEKVLQKEIKMNKIPRAINPSDCLTHYWTAKEALLHFPKLSVGV